MDIDAQNDVIVLEIRTDIPRKVTFHCINLNNGKEISQLNIEKDSWWMSLDKVIDNNVILHQFSEDNKPQQTHIYGFEILKGTQSWKSEGALVEIGENSLNTILPSGETKIIEIRFI